MLVWFQVSNCWVVAMSTIKISVGMLEVYYRTYKISVFLHNVNHLWYRGVLIYLRSHVGGLGVHCLPQTLIQIIIKLRLIIMHHMHNNINNIIAIASYVDVSFRHSSFITQYWYSFIMLFSLIINPFLSWKVMFTTFVHDSPWVFWHDKHHFDVHL